MDSDIVHTINREEMHSQAGFTIFEGKELTGRLVITIWRGEVVVIVSNIIGKIGSGKIIPRAQTQKLT